MIYYIAVIFKTIYNHFNLFTTNWLIKHMDHYILKYLSMCEYLLFSLNDYNLKYNQFLNCKYRRTILFFFFL